MSSGFRFTVGVVGVPMGVFGVVFFQFSHSLFLFFAFFFCGVVAFFLFCVGVGEVGMVDGMVGWGGAGPGGGWGEVVWGGGREEKVEVGVGVGVGVAVGVGEGASYLV